jgi:hypothetical protein
VILSLLWAGCTGLASPVATHGAGSGQGSLPEALRLAPSTEPFSLSPAEPVGRDDGTALSPVAAPAAGSLPPSPSGGETGSETLNCTHVWWFHGEEWSLTYPIPLPVYRYYQGRSRGSERDYAQYAVSDYDRKILRDIGLWFLRSGEERRYSRSETILNLLAFIQAFAYAPDNVSTGYDEYPKYPVETLVEQEGDCEDTSILTVALLNEMGVPAVLLSFPGHMAVGVSWDEPLSLPAIRYQGVSYSYVDTTVPGSSPGEIPPVLRDRPVTVYPMTQTPRMEMSCTSAVLSSTPATTRYQIHCHVENTGSGKATGSHLSIEVLDSSPAPGGSPQEPVSLDLTDFEEGASGWAEHTLVVARNRTTRVRCTLDGDNFLPVVVTSEWFSS